MLSSALRSHAEQPPDDFAEKMTDRLVREHERKILARVVMQERLALAACIVLPAIAIAIAVHYQSAVSVLLEHLAGLTNTFTKDISTGDINWQLWTVFGTAFAFAVYSLVDLFYADS